MSSVVGHAIRRIEDGDMFLTTINAYNENCDDDEIITLMLCLIHNTNAVTRVVLDCNNLTNRSGMVIASYVTHSTTIETLSLKRNNFSGRTYMALSRALCINTSLRCLTIYKNRYISERNKLRVHANFVRALHMNPNRPELSEWHFYSSRINHYPTLKKDTDALAVAPSMVTQLSVAEQYLNGRKVVYQLGE